MVEKTDYDSFIYLNGEYQRLNNSQVIVNTADLEEYYTKEDIDSYLSSKADKSEIPEDYVSTNQLNEALSNINFTFDLCKIVTTLPNTDIETDKLYLVPNSIENDKNKYDIYIYVNGWERIDAIELDLTEYVKTNEVYSKNEIDSLIGDISTYLGE